MIRSRAASAAATNQSRSAAEDGSLPTASVSLASTALLISANSSSFTETIALRFSLGSAGKDPSRFAGFLSCIGHSVFQHRGEIGWIVPPDQRPRAAFQREQLSDPCVGIDGRASLTGMDSMSERAVQATHWGIETEYQDAFGRRRSADPEALARIIEILSQTGKPPKGMLPSTCVIRDGHERRLQLELAPNHVIAWSMFSDGHVLTGANASSFIEIPNELPVGAYRLRATIRSPGGDEHTEETNLLIAPERAFQGAGQGLPRVWVLAVQLYGVRSHRNWGHGDFTDLAGLVDLTGHLGAAGIALNPLHALFDDHAEVSPYSPNSRLFLNTRYIDVEAIPEFPGLQAAGMQEEEVAALRQGEM